ncbi:MAG TPA: PadR family transcriptional regulator [Phototrophicaceae bacterium]|nr:PadR family transcriptional regulator [Phototrophicaceae bacterium]
MMSKKPAASTLSPEYVLLGLLNQQAAHGYDLHERLLAELGSIWHISLSQTYNILKRLEAQGYIIGTVQAQEKSPARRRFSLTPTGRARFECWLNTPTELSSRAIRVEFLTRLYFVYRIRPEAAAGLIETQRAETQAGLARLQTRLHELPPEQVFNRLGLELRVRQLGSILIWLEECRARLSQ